MITMIKKKWVILGALVISLLLVGTALAQGTPTIGWSVVSGGGESTSAANSSLDSTIGQWAVAGGTSGTTQLGSGFWGGGGAEVGGELAHNVSLPIILRQFP